MNKEPNKNVIQDLYADQTLNKKINIKSPPQGNAIASLLLGAEKLSDDFLFAIGIKMGFKEENKFDTTDVSTLVQSAQALGYIVEVGPAS